MKRPSITMLLVVFGLLVAAAEARTPEFLKREAIDLALCLPAPAAENSAETRSELDWMLHIQQTRTPQQVARAGMQAEHIVLSFRDVLGPWFNEDDLPQTMKLLRRVNREGKYWTDQGKQHFSRRRPRFVDPQIRPIFGQHAESCYPSGHAVQSTAVALILAELAPERKPELMELSREIGWNRVIAGVHYPSDSITGRVLGQAVAHALLADPKFREELEKVRPEFVRVSAEHPREPQKGAEPDK